MGTKLTHAPVYYTVAQVQFNPILDLEGFVAAIQSKLRELHYTDFRRDVVQSFVLPFNAGDSGQAAAPTLTQQLRYVFGDMSGGAIFVLETNALSFQTTSYESFASFSDTLLAGLRIVDDALRLDFVERIGLRYLDAVQPSGPAQPLGDLLVPEVLGLSMRSDVDVTQSISQTVATTQAGQLVSRVLIRHGQIGLPDELTMLAPKIDPRFMRHEGLHAIIDTDASVSQREPFDLAKIATRLEALHTEIEKSFRATVTQKALEFWA
jgi:uncharacterized protein (TIGR04255 family)